MGEDQKRPNRLRRWIGGFFLFLVLAALIVHLIWGSVAEHQVLDRIATLQKAGEPILPADFQPPDLPDADNGGKDIVAATALVNLESETWKSFDEMNPALPLRDKERQLIEKLVEKSVPALDRLEIAKTKPHLEWELNLRSPILDNLPDPHQINAPRSIANILGAAAFLDHENGDDAAGLARLDRVLFLGRYYDMYPSIIGHLSSIGCSSMAAQHVIAMAPDLHVGKKAGEASSEQQRQFIDLLLNDRPSQEGLIRAFRGERMEQLDSISCIVNGTAFPSPTGTPSAAWGAASRYFAKPFLYRNASVMLDRMTTLIIAASENNWPKASAKIPIYKFGESKANYFADLFLPGMERVVDIHFRGMADRRLAATTLAIRWYAVEHDGQLPPSLDALVPRYLPSVPLDPFAMTDQPLRYFPNRMDDPVIYSVGPNGVDDGGSEISLDPKHQFVTEWQRQDRVVHLKRQRRPPEPVDEDAATQPSPPQ